jgi:hypothetical protein
MNPRRQEWGEKLIDVKVKIDDSYNVMFGKSVGVGVGVGVGWQSTPSCDLDKYI